MIVTSTFGSVVVALWSSIPGPLVPGSRLKDPPPPEPVFFSFDNVSDLVTSVVPVGRPCGPPAPGFEGPFTEAVVEDAGTLDDELDDDAGTLDDELDDDSSDASTIWNERHCPS